MRRKNFFFVLTFIAYISSATPAQIPDKEKVLVGANRAFEKVTKAYVAPAPGCAAAVSLRGDVLFEKAFGLADMEHNVPNTTQTIFESGSVAKQFTAAAVVLLQEGGKLSLDDPVRKYIPELPALRWTILSATFTAETQRSQRSAEKNPQIRTPPDIQSPRLDN